MSVTIVDTHIAAVRRRLAVVYALVVAENVLDLLWPFAVGLAVNGLIDDSWGGMAVFVALSLTHTAVSLVRQRVESRTTNGLYADLAAAFVERERAAGADTATVAGRTELAGEYVDFLGSDVPLAITAGFGVVGSLAMLFLYDPAIGLAAIVVAAVVALVNVRLMRRSAGIYRQLNDLTEAEVDVIERGRRGESRRHFHVIGRRWVGLSDAEAASWSVVEVVSVGLWVFALARLASGPIDVGDTIAVIAYVASYTVSFDEVPGVLQRFSRQGDIRRRLHQPGGTGDVTPG